MGVSRRRKKKEEEEEAYGLGDGNNYNKFHTYTLLTFDFIISDVYNIGAPYD